MSLLADSNPKLLLLSLPFLVSACSATGPKSSGLSEDTPGSGDSDSDAAPIALGDGDGDGLLPPGENCGNGILDDNEACDDGNNDSDDGCLSNCLAVERGHICKTAGQPCERFVLCGDGQVSFPEQCDDGAREIGDGCNANCKLEIGFKCSAPEGEPSVCTPTTCGDGLVEGAEMCEPSVNEGCTGQCQFAPTCSGEGACTSACGDGLVLGEACDDGNLLDGDGCSATCQIEEGYECPNESTSRECERSPHTDECILRVPVTYRDFSSSHADFNAPCGGVVPKVGLVNTTLTAGKPTPTGLAGAWDAGGCVTALSEWYSDTAQSTTFQGELVLYDDGNGNFINRWGPEGQRWGGTWDGSPFFYPVDGIPEAKDDGGETAQVSTTEYGMDGTLTDDPSGLLRNFGFTSEVTYWFAYDEDTNATLSFIGDDDVWVFVNGRLALDLGGVHPGVSGSFTVSGASPNLTGGEASAHGMSPGNVYEIKVFHAERKPKGSTFKLTLTGFDSRRSDCTAICGDGVIGFGEECDNGVDGNTGGYNGCSEDCRLGAFCGDGVVEDEEECDPGAPDAPADCQGCRIIKVR